MNRWKLAVPVVACITSLFAVGCVVEQDRVQVEDGQPREVVVREAPPVEREEVAPPPPTVRHVWIRGNWHWTGADWAWQPGHYETRRTGAQWIPAHYERRAGGYIYIPGHWRRVVR